MEDQTPNKPQWKPQFDKDKRIYQCFVCGERYDKFDEFKDHIVKNHEEGREYICCPLARCQAPVRDLKAHYKAKHPHDKMPKSGTNRAIIWKDISTKNGKMNTKKPHFREGFMVSNKNGRELHYRSGMECEVYELLERWDEVHKFEEEPFAVKYAHLGIEHDYFPDLRITYKDGSVEIWEVKPSSQTQIAMNKSKWSACNSYCMARSWRFMVLTEKGLRKLRDKISKQEREKKILSEATPPSHRPVSADEADPS